MAQIKLPTMSYKEIGEKGANYALDEVEYNGLTIRQWADKITGGEYAPVVHGHWIIGADNDVLIPAFLVKSTGQVYNLPVHIFEEMGHFIMYEDNWQQVATTIHDWIVEQN